MTQSYCFQAKAPLLLFVVVVGTNRYFRKCSLIWRSPKLWKPFIMSLLQSEQFIYLTVRGIWRIIRTNNKTFSFIFYTSFIISIKLGWLEVINAHIDCVTYEFLLCTANSLYWTIASLILLWVIMLYNSPRSHLHLWIRWFNAPSSPLLLCYNTKAASCEVKSQALLNESTGLA